MSILLTSNKYSDETSQGYFRIGYVVLDIPPQNIVTSHSINNERIGVLRGMNEMYRKTGQSRFDVSVSWIALLDTQSATEKYSQWEDVRTILAMFKAAPFVEVESPYLRQVLAGENPAFAASGNAVDISGRNMLADEIGSGHTIAMALRQMKIESHPDIVDGLVISLTMTYFNYLPYSVNFSYQDGFGGECNAWASQPFKDYINGWMELNFDQARHGRGDPAATPWAEQTPGVFSFIARDYLAVATGQLPLVNGGTNPPNASFSNGSLPAPPVTPVQTPKKADGSQYLTAHFTQRDMGVEGASQSIIANATYICQQLLEPLYDRYGSVHIHDGYRNPAHNAQVGGKTKSYHLFTGGQSAVDIDCPGVGYQALFDYIRFNSNLPFDKVILEHNAAGSLSCVHLQIDSTTTPSRKAFTGQTGNATSYEPQATNTSAPAHIISNVAGYVPPPPVTPPGGSADPVTVTTSDAETAFETFVIQSGLKVDHRTEVGGVGVCFLYDTNSLKVGPYGASDPDVIPNLYTTQISLLFINNFAQIPLEFYQYPTYQHVGPCSSVVQISLTSKGDPTDSGEPNHFGLKKLTNIVGRLEKQYHDMRGKFRAVSSVHRMQALFLENQIVNFFGVYGIITDQVTTQTIPDSSDMVSVQLTGSQYENIFEDIESYKVNGVSDAYLSAVNDIVFNSTQLDNLDTGDAKALQALTDYRNAQKSGDPSWLNTELLKVAKGNDVSIFSDTLSETQFSSVTGLVSLWGAVGTDFSESLSANQPLTGNQNDYPTASQRYSQLISSGSMTWNIVDYLMFKAVFYDGANGLNPLSYTGKSYIDSVESKLQKDGFETQQIQQAYIDLFPFFTQHNLDLGQAVNQLMNSPKFSDQITAGVSTTDPATASNSHGSYAGMGLFNMTQAGQDLNPAMYFTNFQDSYRKIAKTNLTSVLGAITGGSSLSGSQSINSSTNSGSSSPNVVNLSTSTTIPGDLNSIMGMTNIPGYSMAEAFPAIKLFFLEDANNGVYYAFDNFYSYAAITDMEMVRPYNQPATLRIQMTNLSHLLNNKLFDGTFAGAWDKQLNRFALEGGAVLPDGQVGPISGAAPIAGTVFKNNPNTTPTQVIDVGQYGYDHTEGPLGGQTKYQRVPLQYFPLQTGTKIQLRMGDTNNPDNLFPVFCGQVTEIEGDEIITITAQSYMLELFSEISDKVSTDSWFHLGAVVGAAPAAVPWWLVPGGPPGTTEGGIGPAYGGLTLFGGDGTTATVIAKLLRASNARHFGHWQINQQPNGLLKGFAWKELAIQDLGAVTGSSMISNLVSYDRCDENINVAEITVYNGSSLPHTTGHTYADEGNWWRPAGYYIDGQTDLTLWELIQDVARRYPEFLLLEKWYGFPYSCDATLVYGHPFDWYWSRPKMVGDQEKERVLLKDPNIYQEWWNASGKDNLTGALSLSNLPGDTISFLPLIPGLIQTASQNYEGLLYTIKTVIGWAAGKQVPDSWWGSGTINWAGEREVALLNGIFEGGQDKLYRFEKMLDDISRSAIAYAESKQNANGTVVSSELLKPIRRYHFIDQQSIIHNGMTINSKIYNCIKISDAVSKKNPESKSRTYSILANANIPAVYVRALDVTERINLPTENVINQSLEYDDKTDGKYGLIMAYAQSFLREEVGKMYRGEIILRGIPEIEPMDVLLLNDNPGALQGPVEVESVTHLMNQEVGFITIIKPRACVAVNEDASGSFLRVLMKTMNSSLPEVLRIIPNGSEIAKLGTDSTGHADSFSIINGIAGHYNGLDPRRAGLLLLSVAGILGATALGFTNSSSGNNPLFLMPCIRYGRPFVGGIEGWAINDLIGVFNNKIYQFANDEVWPLLQLWMQAKGYENPIMGSDLQYYAPQIPTYGK